MIKILVANSLDNSMQELVTVFEQQGDTIVAVVNTGSQVLECLSSQTFDLVVTAERLQDMPGLGLIKKIIEINPMVNCAAASDLTPEDFHEESEGMGILMQLPVFPRKEHGTALLKRAKEISNLLGQD